MDALRRGPRVDTEFIGQEASDLPVGSESLALAMTGVQRAQG
jgi:hypothetical protein